MFYLTNEDSKAERQEVPGLWPLVMGDIALTSRVDTFAVTVQLFSQCCITWSCLSFPKCSTSQSFSKFSICAELQMNSIVRELPCGFSNPCSIFPFLSILLIQTTICSDCYIFLCQLSILLFSAHFVYNFHFFFYFKQWYISHLPFCICLHVFILMTSTKCHLISQSMISTFPLLNNKSINIFLMFNFMNSSHLKYMRFKLLI